MSERRRHSRVQIAAPFSGAMRVSHNVALRHTADGCLTVFSPEAAAIDEELVLAVASDDLKLQLRVKVIESRPVVIDGAVRHELKLLTLG